MVERKSTPKKHAGEWRPAFLSALRNSANVRASCQTAGIDRKTAYKARDASVEFRKQWDDAIEDACDVLEAEAWQRARGESDTLLIFLLKAHRPAKYRETIRQEHSGPGGAPIEVDVAGLTDDERVARIATLLNRLREKRDRQTLSASPVMGALAGPADAGLSEPR